MLPSCRRVRTFVVCLLAFAADVSAQPSSLAPIDPFNRQAVVDLYNSAYVEALAVPNDWTGNRATCTAGTTSAAYADATITMVNYFRAMTQLPSAIPHDPVKDAKSQLAALMMTANNSLSHSPPPSWLCFSAGGAEAAGKSNLALGVAGARAVVAYVRDGGVWDLGHRRWVLFPRQTDMGTGSTGNANALWVLGPFGTRPTTPEWVAWPNAGFVPYQVVFPRWSFSVNTGAVVDFSGATVTMTRGGIPVPVTVDQLTNGYGDKTIGWDPTGLVTGAGMADQAITVAIENVVVGGLAKQFTYTVTIIDPATATGSVPGAPTGVSAVAGNAQATVSFTAPASTGSSPITSYTVTATPGGATASGSGSPLIVTGLTNGTAYTFRVTATNSAGTGPSSAPSVPVTPVGPLQFVGAPKNFSVTAVAGSTVSFAWTAGTGTLPITSYLFEAGVTPGSVLGSVPIPGAGTTFTVALPTGAFYVRLYAQSGATRSAVSNEIRVFVNVPAPPSAPTNLLGLVNGSSIGLSWVNTAGGGAAAGLILDVSGSLATSVPLPVTESVSTPGVPPGTYTLTVRATNAAGTSAPSNPVTLTFPGPCSGAPLRPVGFSATRSGNTITVSWMPPATGPSLASYTLAVSGAFVGSIPTTTRSLSGTVLPGSYTFSVTATNACGTSAATTPQTVTVP